MFIRFHPWLKNAMKDGPVRRTIKRIALIRYQFDLRVARSVRNRTHPPRYKLAGSCQGCGLCCETPMIQTLSLFRRLRTTRWVILTWHRVINGFEHLRDDPKTNSFIFRCTHFDPKTRQCDSYDSRPGMCRDYPRNLLDAPFPEFLDGCGYHAIDENADKLNAALEKLDLPEEKLKELQRKLHTKE